MSIKQIIKRVIDTQSKQDEVAVLLSGGVDSLSVAFAAHELGKKVHAYSFHLDTGSSYDSDKAAEVSQIFKWPLTIKVVPTDNLEEDFFKLAKEYDCKKKTHFECVFPFMYLYPEIRQEEVLSGWAADGYYGISKRAILHYTKGKTKEKFDEFRNDYFLPTKSAGYMWHKIVADKHNKKFITPYLSKAVRDFFYSKDWYELNEPFQKHHVVNDFEQFKKFNFKKHINLQLGAGIDKRFETLLNNSKINPNNRYKSVSGICQYWGKAV